MNPLSIYQPLLAGGDFSDIYLEESSSLSIRWEDGKIESVAAADDSGLGLRFLHGLETRYGHTQLVRPITAPGAGTVALARSLKDTLGAGDAKARLIPLRDPVLKSHSIRIRTEDATLDEKVRLVERAFRAAQLGAQIRQVNVNYGEKRKKVGYLNSDGECFIEDRTYVVMSVTVTAERGGVLQTAYESMGGLCGLEGLAPEAVEAAARVAAERAILKLDAPPAPSGEMPVVIAACAGGTLIHEAVGHSLEADAVLEGTSPSYIGKVGQVVANPKLTVYDNPTVPGARGSFHFDDEGTPSEASRLIESGVLMDLMYDRLSARRAGRKSNGHGRRESYAHRPIPRMSNTYIAPGPDDPDEILRSFQNGMLVTRMGGGQVNTANGDFVFEVEEGFLVRNGKKSLVRGATLLGNGPETLKLIDQVGSDHGWGIGTCGKEGQGVPVSDAIPTIHITKLVIGGAGKAG